MSLQGTDLALVSARIGVARIGAFRLGFFPEDVEGVGTVGPGEYAWREIVPEDDGQEWEIITAWSMCAEKCVASFTYQPQLVKIGTVISFTDTTTPAPELTFWHWEFGDGSSSDEQSPTHFYAHNGAFTVQLWASGPHGACYSSQRIVVADELLVTIVAIPDNGNDPLDVAFTSIVTGGVPPFVYAWDFGDGGTDGNVAATSHIFNWNGVDNPTIWTVTLTVTDSVGGIAVDTQDISVMFGA